MSTKQKYLGLTVGPIYGTIIRARKTRQLWTASTLFSYLMEQIVTHYEGHDDDKLQVILPTLPKSGLVEMRYGTGLVPDRLIAASGEGHLVRLQAAISAGLKDMATMMLATKRYPESDRTVEDLQAELRVHYQTYIVEVEVAVGSNPILEVNRYLDIVEVQAQFNREPRPKGDFLDKYFLCSHHADETKAAFGQAPEAKEIHFRSLAEIGLHGLLHRHDDTGKVAQRIVNTWVAAGDNANESNLIRLLKGQEQVNEAFRTYHKYVAFIYADADNVGKTLGKLSVAEARQFSDCLLSFGQKSAKAVADYGGLPIYIGGDDLLLVVPVATFLGGESGPNHLFDLLELLRSIFEEAMEPVVKIAAAKKDPEFLPPTLSFGISVTYYKHPMQEAMEAAAHQLFEVAKKVKFPGGTEKNALAIHLIKHSGSPRYLLLNQAGKLYDQFCQSMSAVLTEKEKQLSSFAQKIRSNEVIVNALIEMGDVDRIMNFLHSSFDEDVHSLPEIKKYMDGVAALLACGNDGRDGQAYDCLELIHFLKRKDHD